MLPQAARTCVTQAFILLGLNEAWEGAVLHQAIDSSLCHNKTGWTWLLETLTDDLSSLKIEVYLQKTTNTHL